MHTPQSNAKAQNGLVPGHRITLTLLIIAVAMTGVIFAWLVYGVSYSYSTHVALRERALRIQALRGSISHLDEVLTMSARMAAATGNLMWEERYRRFEPQLDAAIKEAITLAPGIESAESAAQTDVANLALVDMEHRAFHLVREQREEEAQAVLFSEAYETQKRIYAEGMQKFIEALGASLHTEAHTEWRQIARAVAAFVVTLAIAICAWLAVTRSLFRSRTMLLHHMAERQRVEATMLKSEEYRNLFKHANDAILIFDPEEEIVLDVNDKACNVYGLPRDTFIGRSLKDLTLDVSRAEQQLKRLLVEGTYQEFETVQRRADGTPIDFLVNASVIEFQGHSAVLSINRDITERRRAEALLKEERALLARRVTERTADLSAANAELARANRLKDEFLANMSHELRTPLNSVLGLAEALQEGVYEPMSAEQCQIVQAIEESGRHLLALINDILDLSKIEAGKVTLDMAAVSVESVYLASLRLISQGAQKKQLRVSSNFDNAVTTIQADERRLKQILVNLLSNAVKFTPAGGTIGLDVTGDTEQGVAHFTVWDTGIGIAPEESKRLFQPFIQLDSRLARQHEGTGLGLALVYRMAELHGGSVSVASAEGHGSRFTLSLPWHVGAIAPVEDAAPDREGSAPLTTLRRALIIEDSLAAADQITRYLGEMGITAVVHPGGRGVVSKALSYRPDVIILDLLLPELSGWSVLEELQAEPETQPIPVIVVSVMEADSQGLVLGASAQLVKPITRQQLHAALHNLGAQTAAAAPLGRVVQSIDTLRLAQEEAIAPALVLLAEDNESNTRTFSDYLHARGYRLAVARCGEEALARARETLPEVIVMDMQMPGMDGLEATRLMRQDEALKTIPIIALTALAMPGDRQRCLAAGANAYLQKPVSLRKLVQVIEAQRQKVHGL